MLDGLMEILKQAFYWVLAQVVTMAAAALAPVAAVWPKHLSGPVAEVAHYLHVANHWVPLAETYALLAAWVAVVLVYFVVKVVLYLF